MVSEYLILAVHLSLHGQQTWQTFIALKVYLQCFINKNLISEMYILLFKNKKLIAQFK